MEHENMYEGAMAYVRASKVSDVEVTEADGDVILEGVHIRQLERAAVGFAGPPVETVYMAYFDEKVEDDEDPEATERTEVLTSRALSEVVLAALAVVIARRMNAYEQKLADDAAPMYV